MQKPKTPREITLVRFGCIITTKNAEKKHTFIELSPIIQRGGKGLFKDKNDNTFEYDLITYQNEIFTPKIDFDLFSFDEGKFSDNFKRAYFEIHNAINNIIEDQETIQFIIQQIKSNETKELFKKHLKELKISHKLYFPEFDEIYLKNSNQMTNITPEELKFIRLNGHRRITRQSSFLILLHRHRNDEDFLLECDLNDETSLKDLWEKFYDSYNHTPKIPESPQ